MKLPHSFEVRFHITKRVFTLSGHHQWCTFTVFGSNYKETSLRSLSELKCHHYQNRLKFCKTIKIFKNSFKQYPHYKTFCAYLVLFIRSPQFHLSSSCCVAHFTTPLPLHTFLFHSIAAYDAPFTYLCCEIPLLTVNLILPHIFRGRWRVVKKAIHQKTKERN
jgi:hypothetical protein